MSHRVTASFAFHFDCEFCASLDLLIGSRIKNDLLLMPTQLNKTATSERPASLNIYEAIHALGSYSSMQSFLSLAVLFLPSASTQFQGNTQFHITNQATITCEAAGFKCGYNDYEFAAVDVTGTGQESAGGFAGSTENLVWSPLDVTTDQLVLSSCQVDYCLVICNVGCDCVDETGAPCASGSLAPTPAPSAASGTQTCPQVANTEFCSELNAALQPGNLENFDCFNFCGGVLVGTCSFDGVCGDLACATATDSGSQGLVQGCTKALLLGEDTSKATKSQTFMKLAATLTTVLVALVL